MAFWADRRLPVLVASPFQRLLDLRKRGLNQRLYVGQHFGLDLRHH
jgi:hypothetical protein